MSKCTESGKKLVEKIKSNKKLQYLIVAVLTIVVVAIFFTSLTSTPNKEEKTNQLNEYVLQLQNNLESTLSKVEGAGEVSVVINVESGMETVLAMETIKKETSSSTEIKETPVIVNGKPIVLKEKYPKIVGVLIVAEGAKNISVLTKIQQATVSLLDININQIEILTMK